MNGRTFLNFSIAIAVFVGAISIGLGAYYELYKPMKQGPPIVAPTPKEVMPVRQTPGGTPAADSAAPIVSLAIDTNYKGYFENGDRCRQSYNEMFGDKTGSFSSNSACNLTLKFDREGRAEKTIVIRKFDPQTSSWKDVESTRWTGSTDLAAFEKLAAALTGNSAYKDWNSNISLTARNTMISVKHADGFVKSPMSNVDEKTTVFIAMIDAFKELDLKTAWSKAK